jgi:hypothetical protein
LSRKLAPLEVAAAVVVGVAEAVQARESSDSPILNAFCRVAPSLRFKVRAMLGAFVFLFASVFSVRTWAVVHARRFDFLAI